MYKRLYVKYPLFLSDFNQYWISLQISDTTKLIVALRNLAKAPKKIISWRITRGFGLGHWC